MKSIKSKFKKLVALGIGIVLLGSTFVGAASTLNLNSYPAPFVDENGVYDTSTAIVVGATAAASDTLGAVNIATNLQFLSKESKMIESSQTIYGGETENLNLGDGMSDVFGIMTNSDLDYLHKGDIEIDEVDVKTTEEIHFTNDFEVAYGGQYDKDLEETPALKLAKDSVSIRYIFHRDFEFDENFKINFQGKDIEISDLDENSATIKTGTTYVLNNGDIAKYGEKTITIDNIGLSSVVVDVDGIKEIIPSSSTEKVNGISVKCEQIVYVDETEGRTVKLTIGDKVTSTINSGDSAIEYGEPEKEDDSNWLWEISVDKDVDEIQAGSYIALEWNRKLDEKGEMLEANESIKMPDNSKITFVETNNPIYITYDFEIEGNYVLVDSPDDSGFQYGNGYDDKVFVNSSGIYNGDYELVTNVYFGDSDISLSLDNRTGPTMDTIVINDGEEIATNLDLDDLEYESSSIADREETTMTSYGVLIDSPEDHIEDNEITLKVPEEQLKVKVNVGGTKTVTGEETTYDVPKQIVINTKLDTEIVSPEKHNLILVGGPVVNSLTAKFIGTDWTLISGEALIQLVENGDNVALIIAGTDAMDTRLATRELSEGKILTEEDKTILSF